MKILVPGRVLDRQVGGNTRYARALYSGLRSTGIDYRVARPGRSAIPRGIAYVAYESLRWPITPPSDIDLLHFPADTGALIPSRIPIVTTVHGLATLHVDNVRRPAADAIWKYRVSRSVAVSRIVITVSESSARDIVSVDPGAAKKIRIVHHGIDHNRFAPGDPVADANALNSIGVADPYFLYVGNLDPRKNLIELTAAAEAQFKITGIPLLISGAPAWESEQIMAAINGTPGVRYLGRVSEELLLPLIRGAVAMCFPSSYEGFGFPVLEAMACGTPVLCSDRGSLREVAADSALMLTELDSQTIAAGMVELATDPGLRQELAHRGIANAQRFQWATSVRMHADAFREALQ